MTILLDNYPPSTLQGVGLGAVKIRELLSERILVISAPPIVRRRKFWGWCFLVCGGLSKHPYYAAVRLLYDPLSCKDKLPFMILSTPEQIAEVRDSLLRVRRGCQASQREGLTSGEVPELPGKSPKTSREVWETSGQPLDCC